MYERNFNAFDLQPKLLIMPPCDASPDSDPVINDEVQCSGNESSRSGNFKMMASAAAGAMLGMPIDSSGALRAAWVEVSQWIAALQKF